MATWHPSSSCGVTLVSIVLVGAALVVVRLRSAGSHSSLIVGQGPTHDSSNQSEIQSLNINQNANGRTWITIHASPFHGSTALESALMSSGIVATLCSANTWQCEVKCPKHDHSQMPLCRDFDVEEKSRIERALLNATNDFQVIAVISVVWRLYIDRFSSYWDLNKPYLLTKWSPTKFVSKNPAKFDPSLAKTLKLAWRSSNLPPGFDLFQTNFSMVVQGLTALNNNMPSMMKEKGITSVRWVNIIMFSPWCLWPLSSHAVKHRESNLTQWALEELQGLTKLAEQYKMFVAQGIPVLLINYADLLWEPERFKLKLFEFLPSLATSSLPYEHFIPQIGKDIFEGNKLKQHVHGDISSFGLLHKPQNCCQYDSKRAICMGDPRLVYDGLDSESLQKAQDLFKNDLIGS